MLVEKDGTGEGHTLFKCDRCKKHISREIRYGIYIQEYRLSPKKRWDLCPQCFKALCRGIEKGKSRRYI